MAGRGQVIEDNDSRCSEAVIGGTPALTVTVGTWNVSREDLVVGHDYGVLCPPHALRTSLTAADTIRDTERRPAGWSDRSRAGTAAAP